MNYMVNARTVMLLGLLAATSILLAAGSSLAWVRANHRERQAVRVIQNADSLVKDWVGRGCAPRATTVP